MEIQLIRESIPFCRELGHQTKLIQENVESIVSDIYEDIGAILSSCAQLCLKSKDVTQHGVSITGSAEICVLYINESRGAVQCLNLSKDFSADFDLPTVTIESQCQVCLHCMGVQARAVNSRKVAVQLSIRADMTCWSDESLSYAMGAEEAEQNALYLKRQSAVLTLPTQITEKSFSINEQIPLSLSQNTATRVLSTLCELRSQDSQMIGGKALIKGTAHVQWLTLSDGDSLPQRQEAALPFSVLIDAADEKSVLSSVVFQPTAVYSSFSEAINGSSVMELELHVIAQACFEKQTEIRYLTDAYSTRYPIDLKDENTVLALSRTFEAARAEAQESLTLDEGGFNVQLCNAQILSVSVKNDTITASASLEVLLSSADGTLSTVQKLVSAQTPLSKGDMTLQDAEITSYSCELSGNELTMKAFFSFQLTGQEKTSLSTLSEAELDTEAPYSVSSQPPLSAVKQRGRTLWELAKAYNSSEDAIEKLNESYPMPNGILLIPRI